MIRNWSLNFFTLVMIAPEKISSYLYHTHLIPTMEIQDCCQL